MRQTVRLKMESLLTENGLWPDEAKAVMNAMVAEDKTMGKKWSDWADGYSVQMLDTLFVIAKREAVKWIDANKPLHFARPMFAE